MHNIKIGDKDVKFVRSRGEVVYPNYVKDGLVLWYDFSGMENSGVKRGVAEDLSGNGNDGVLENFAFDEGSGYVNNGLEFDGVDDNLVNTIEATFSDYDFSFELSFTAIDYNFNQLFARFGGNGSLIRLGTINQLRLYYTIGTSLFNVLLPANPFDFQRKACYTLVFSNNVNQTILNYYYNGRHNGAITLEGRIQKTDGLTNFAFQQENFSLKCNLHSFRKYNRALSPEEIAHNYKIDKHRFNIQD